MENNNQRAVVFFDGFCHLCNGLIDFLIKIDSQKKLMFAPLQGKTFKQVVRINLNPDTIVFILNGQVFLKSQAVIKIFFHVGGFWKLFSVLLSIMPLFVRDFFYDLIANNRYKLFGKKSHCRLPAAEEKERFLE
ncbi:MAG: DUF393 domain-containing protein [Oligoflexia bacterium]|nr:DUF393 domain-containing protein [Oligoflexia bacterium]